jgi:uncharacterized membrane protein YkoI
MVGYLIICFFMLSSLSWGKVEIPEELVKSMVPQGEITSFLRRDFTVKTTAGTKIIIEFDRNGTLDEASGLNLGKGDIFEPGNGLISLSSAAQVIHQQGVKVAPIWRLEKDPKHDWVYEFEEEVDERTVEHLVNARNGKIIKTVVPSQSSTPDQLNTFHQASH